MTGSGDRAPKSATTTGVGTMSYLKLFDLLQEMLGLGDFAGEPSEFRAWKMKEIGIMKRIMMYRRLSPNEMLLCAQFCKAHRLQPESITTLLWHYDDAMKWARLTGRVQ